MAGPVSIAHWRFSSLRPLVEVASFRSNDIQCASIIYDLRSVPQRQNGTDHDLVHGGAVLFIALRCGTTAIHVQGCFGL